MRHVRKLDEKPWPPYRCVVCSKTFGFNSERIRHLKTSRMCGKSYYSCDSCDQTFGDERSLKKHKLSAHKNASHVLLFTCNTCNAGFQNKHSLKRHHLIKHDNWALMCNSCGKPFKYQSQLMKHRCANFGTEAFTCDTCSKTFKQKSHLSVHALTHETAPHQSVQYEADSEAEDFPCKKCDKSFKQKSGLTVHEWRAHVKNDRYLQCDSSSTSSSVREVESKKCETKILGLDRRFREEGGGGGYDSGAVNVVSVFGMMKTGFDAAEMNVTAWYPGNWDPSASNLYAVAGDQVASNGFDSGAANFISGVGNMKTSSGVEEFKTGSSAPEVCASAWNLGNWDPSSALNSYAVAGDQVASNGFDSGAANFISGVGNMKTSSGVEEFKTGSSTTKVSASVCDMSALDLDNCDLNNCNLDNCNLENLDLEYLDLEYLDLDNWDPNALLNLHVGADDKVASNGSDSRAASIISDVGNVKFKSGAEEVKTGSGITEVSTSAWDPSALNSYVGADNGMTSNGFDFGAASFISGGVGELRNNSGAMEVSASVWNVSAWDPNALNSYVGTYNGMASNGFDFGVASFISSGVGELRNNSSAMEVIASVPVIWAPETQFFVNDVA